MDTLLAELQRYFGHDDFRLGQREIVESVLAGNDTLAVLPTGGGKSLTYQLPAMLVDGATLVLSPLIALMKDQAENLPDAVRAQTTVINSSLSSSEVGRRLAEVKSGRIRMIYAAPERLRQPPFLHALRQAKIALVVIDEAHCISQWGHDFRPDYRAVGQAITALAPRAVLAVTATATPEVQNDIERQVGRSLTRIIRPTFRENLHLSCHKVSGEDEKLAATLQICQSTPGVGLIYAGSRDKCEALARMLSRYRIEAGFYHAGLPPDERAAAQDRFMSGQVRVMAATVAFGMGVDKSDIRFLIHYHPSRTLENYYQEAGRAGRDGLPSQGILLWSTSDAASSTRRLREDLLSLDDVKAVYAAVRQTLGRRRCGPVSWESLSGSLENNDNLLRSALPLLEEVGLIARYTDIPRNVTLWPETLPMSSEEEIAPLPEHAESLLRAIGGGGNFAPDELATASAVSLPDLERAILECQGHGLLTYRAAPRDLMIELLNPPDNSKQQIAALLGTRASGAKERADQMLSYARDRKCRHGQIARYFGDRWALGGISCAQCDVCAPQGDGGGHSRQHSAGVGASPSFADGEANSLSPPLVALQIVHDLAQGYRPFAIGKTGLIRALRGTPDAPIRPERTSAFGLLAGFRKTDADKLIEALIAHDLLRRDDEDEYRRLYLTGSGSAAVRDGECDIAWQTGAQQTAARDAALQEDADPALLFALKEWRKEMAERDNVPAYVVFSDKVLNALAAQQPLNEFALQEISGIGPSKAARWGADVIEQVRRYQERSVTAETR